jgi:DNA-directed RNA polymerase subunit RPC12/RpoP
MKCPKCSTEMHTNTIIALQRGAAWKKYQECPKCGYKTKAK